MTKRKTRPAELIAIGAALAAGEHGRTLIVPVDDDAGEAAVKIIDRLETLATEHGLTATRPGFTTVTVNGGEIRAVPALTVSDYPDVAYLVATAPLFDGLWDD